MAMQPLGLSRVARAKLGAKAIDFDLAALSGWRAARWVDDWIGAAELVIIDAPPHPETEARIAVRVARLVVVPVQPFPLDPVGDGGNTQNRRETRAHCRREPSAAAFAAHRTHWRDLASTGTPIAATWIGQPCCIGASGGAGAWRHEDAV
jgi:hypothetical protein